MISTFSLHLNHLSRTDFCVPSPGPDWDSFSFENQDGGIGGRGVVSGFRNDRMEVLVIWQRTKRQSNYRWSACYDVRILQSVLSPDDPAIVDGPLAILRKGVLAANGGKS